MTPCIYSSKRHGAVWLLLLCSFVLGLPRMGLAAQVDRSTPRAQNGLTLLAVVRGDGHGQYRFPVPADMAFLEGPTGNGSPGGLGLWVKGPAMPTPAPGQPYDMGQPTVTAHAANGETLSVQANRQNGPQYPSQTAFVPLYLLVLPGGYPAGYGPIDVTFTDPKGHSALWRITGLPPSFHAIPGHPAMVSTVAKDGVTMTASAWVYPGQASFGRNAADFRGVYYQIFVKTPAGSPWIVRITKQQLEWEALRPGEDASPPGIATEYFDAVNTRRPSYVPRIQMNINTPYAVHDHYLRVEGQLVQLAAAEETVTFHNLTVRPAPDPRASQRQYRGPQGVVRSYTPPPSYELDAKPQTVTTPSGISVSLLPLSSLPSRPPMFGGYPSSLRLLLKISPSGSGQRMRGRIPMALPRSPLYRKYHQPITVSLQSPAPYALESLFPVREYAPQANSEGEFVAILRILPLIPRRTGPNSPVRYVFPSAMPGGYQGGPPPMPKFLPSLTFTVTQQAELTTFPITFLVPIARQAPPSPAAPVRHIPPPRPMKMPR